MCLYVTAHHGYCVKAASMTLQSFLIITSIDETLEAGDMSCDIHLKAPNPILCLTKAMVAKMIDKTIVVSEMYADIHNRVKTLFFGTLANGGCLHQGSAASHTMCWY